MEKGLDEWNFLGTLNFLLASDVRSHCKYAWGDAIFSAADITLGHCFQQK